MTAEYIIFTAQENAIARILNDYGDELRAAFNRHDSTIDGAKAVNAKVQAGARENHLAHKRPALADSLRAFSA